MIGVIANHAQHAAVREFFELFKTPWEFYRNDRDYEVLLCVNEVPVETRAARLVIVYGSHELPLDISKDQPIGSRVNGTSVLLAKEMRIPIYKGCVTFAPDPLSVLIEEQSGRGAAYEAAQADGSKLVRIGYNILEEISALLTDWQPPANAPVPTLDCHISLLRSIIVDKGIPLVEIPPVPEGYNFIACLTHDVDHPSIRLHRFDHTMFGFLYRATIGSLLALARGRASVRSVFANWAAAFKLPFVYMGLAKDFWNDLATYNLLEGGSRSSFFVIPFKRRPGAGIQGSAPAMRASAYGAADIASEIGQLSSNGNEIGLHGIDAWNDSSKAREELAEIHRITGAQETGIRMHWLYFDKNSSSVLDRAGFDYDSTVGYNEAVGYRAGTSQVYKPLGVTRLLELPLHIMDTALFSPGRQDLSSAEASNLVRIILDHAVQNGGVVTINWHDRSIAPERLWKDFYIDLIGELNRRGAWLTNARETVSWFRKRRSAAFNEFEFTRNGHLNITGSIEVGDNLPNLRIHVHNAPVRYACDGDFAHAAEQAVTHNAPSAK